MKTRVITAAFFLLTCTLTAQLSSIDMTTGVGRSFFAEKGGIEAARLAWKAGININFQVAKQFNLKTGIYHNQLSYLEIDVEDLRWPSEHDGSGGFELDPSLERRIKRSRSYRFIEIPLELRYELLEGKIRPYVEAGMGINFYRSTKAINDTNLEYTAITSKESSVNDLNLFGNVSHGIAIGIRKLLNQDQSASTVELSN